MPTTKDARTDNQIDSQLTESIRQLHEVSSRIDERIKYLIEKQTMMAEKIEKLSETLADNATRIAILEQSGIYKARESIEEIDKKQAILERQLNNGIRNDVKDLQDRIRTLELSNEHNTSFRTKGEARLEWWLNVGWKVIQIIGAAALAFYLSKK